MTLNEGVLQFLNLLALATGVAYAVLAARRDRRCWIAGAVSAICAAILSAEGRLPMQAALQVYYVVVAAYGWWNWGRGSEQGEVIVGTWPATRHLAAALLLIGASFISAHWLKKSLLADWPLLDSLTTWFSVYATWLAARARLENWLFWVVINAVMVFLFYVQHAWGMALLSLLLMGIAISGYLAWRRRWRAQADMAVTA